MKASVGDRIVLASSQVDAPVRDGRILEIKGPDGAPPYMVEWSGSGKVALVYPGPDAHVEPFGNGDGEAAKPAEPTLVKTWRVQIDIFESGDDTKAHATLTAESPLQVEGHGETHRNAMDKAVAAIGDEVAAARALRRLADSLLSVASEDISTSEGRTVSLRG